MKALDTNILVRFLVRDDTIQAEKVRILFEEAEKAGNVFFISIPVVLELIWVLDAVYNCSRPAILTAIEQLNMLPFLRFESSDRIHRLISTGRSSNTDLPDIMIGLSALDHQCSATITFDRKTATSSLFDLLS
jgi:predicted nucleic-acid-binding protein